MKIIIVTTVYMSGAPNVPSVHKSIEIEGALYAATEGAKAAAAALVTETVDGFVEVQEDVLEKMRPADDPEAWAATHAGPAPKVPASKAQDVRPDHVARLVTVGRETSSTDGYTPAEVLAAMRSLNAEIDNDLEAWDALANLMRTPQAVHDAAAEEGSD